MFKTMWSIVDIIRRLQRSLQKKDNMDDPLYTHKSIATAPPSSC